MILFFGSFLSNCGEQQRGNNGINVAIVVMKTDRTTFVYGYL